MSKPPDQDRMLHLLLESVSEHAIYMLDAEGRVTTWNTGAERLMGYGRAEIMGQPFERFFSLEDRRAGAPHAILALAREAGRTEHEGWRLRKDGSRFWASSAIDTIRDEAGRHVGFAEVTRDISERKATEKALMESERQFRLLVSGVVDYALYMLDPNGIVTNWNAGAQHIKGYAAEEIVGQHFSRFYSDVDRAAGLPMRALQTATEQGRYEAEGWRVRKDGGLFWASVVIDAIRDETGRLVGFAKITRDITDKRNAQLELQKAHEQLAHAQRMEALGQLTGGVAHDFNNLLMVVSGQAQLLRSKVGDDPRALRALDAIETSAKRGEDLTRHLLSFARRQRLQPVSISVTEQALGTKEMLAASLPATVQMVVDLPRKLWAIEADPGELELGLLNLAVNARDAMPAGGVLSICAENVVLDGKEPAELTGEFVALSVSDTGVGIPPDILPRVFDPFFTTKEVNKGTGLGLSQVYGFAQQSGGGVTVKSELGKGTRFTLYLPRARGRPVAASDDAPSEVVAGVRILVVEDNPQVAEVAAAMLEQLGHEVRVAGDAAAAIEMLRQQERPDLVFSDIVMAGEIDGLGLARRLREEAPSMPVLLATGYSHTAGLLGCEFPILRKPYKMAELSRAVAAALASSKLVRLENAREARTARRVRSGPQEGSR